MSNVTTQMADTPWYQLRDENERLRAELARVTADRDETAALLRERSTQLDECKRIISEIGKMPVGERLQALADRVGGSIRVLAATPAPTETTKECRHDGNKATALTGGAGPDDATHSLECARCGAHGWRWNRQAGGDETWHAPPTGDTTKALVDCDDGEVSK